MESLIILKIPTQTKEALLRRAALRGHSMEEEARIILREAVLVSTPRTLGWATQFRTNHDIAGLYAKDSKEIDWVDRNAGPSSDHRIPSFE